MKAVLIWWPRNPNFKLGDITQIPYSSVSGFILKGTIYKKLTQLSAYPLMKAGQPHFTLDKEGSITIFLKIILTVKFVEEVILKASP